MNIDNHYRIWIWWCWWRWRRWEHIRFCCCVSWWSISRIWYWRSGGGMYDSSVDPCITGDWRMRSVLYWGIFFTHNMFILASLCAWAHFCIFCIFLYVCGCLRVCVSSRVRVCMYLLEGCISASTSYHPVSSCLSNNLSVSLSMYVSMYALSFWCLIFLLTHLNLFSCSLIIFPPYPFLFIFYNINRMIGALAEQHCSL